MNLSDINNLQWWVHVANAGTVVALALSLLCGGIGFFLNKRLGELKDEKATNEQTESKEKIAELDLKRAEAERELANIKEGLRSRIVSPEQRKIIVDYLKDKPKGSIQIRDGVNTSESHELCEQWKDLMTELGWNVQFDTALIPMSFIGLGIEAKNPTNQAAGHLQIALKKAGIDAQYVINKDRADDSIFLLVGRKPDVVTKNTSN